MTTILRPIQQLICHRSPGRSSKAYSSKMGVKARKKAITNKLKNGANDLSASSASKDEARDFLPLEGGPAQKLPKTEVRENKATVLYIGRIPHGFYENEMEVEYLCDILSMWSSSFFKQFGTIKRLRIARNKKASVLILQYRTTIFFHKLIRFYSVSVIVDFIGKECEEVENLVRRWKGVNRWYKPLDWVKIERKRQDKERTLDDRKKLVEGILKRDKKRQKRIEAARIDYDCPEIILSSRTDAASKISMLAVCITIHGHVLAVMSWHRNYATDGKLCAA
ncbi:hypothetical protein HAX54_027276 [Datura stramonium]|uniref:Uncharacterized protein n=1 Tax=Datura stramonium TaxID=4076 RepID=A0ABS8V2I2_DATST|nr:hypothetical protein [Datura stramonium]